MLARYWRVRALTVQSGSNFALSEIELRATSGGADLTGSGTAISGGNFNVGTNPPSNCYDNNTATWWAGPTNGVTDSWVGYDFGSDVEVLEAVLTARNDTAFGQAPTNFAIECSADNVTWTNVKGYVTSGWTTGSSQTFAVPAAPVGAPARVFAAGVQRLYEPKDPPVRVFGYGVQVIRGASIAPPATGRRRQQQVVT